MLKLLLLIIIIIFINYIIKKRKEILYKKKTQILKNKNIKYIKNDENLINILFSIKEYYYYNEQAYNEFIDNLELFLKFMEFIKIDNSLGGQLYQNLLDIKKNIINNLISMNIKLPNEYNLQTTIQDIESILNSYLKECHLINEGHIKQFGINYTTKFIILNDIEPYNSNINIFEQKIPIYFNRS
jgi:hypothetical protein